MNVGQMRYFYKMEVLNDAEKKLCRDFIMSYQGNDVIDFDLRTLYFYEAYANMVKLRESDPNIRQQYPDIDDWSYEDEFDPQVNISKATFYSKSA